MKNIIDWKKVKNSPQENQKLFIEDIHILLANNKQYNSLDDKQKESLISSTIEEFLKQNNIYPEAFIVAKLINTKLDYINDLKGSENYDE